jgi:hypothetical protein
MTWYASPANSEKVPDSLFRTLLQVNTATADQRNNATIISMQLPGVVGGLKASETNSTFKTVAVKRQFGLR